MIKDIETFEIKFVIKWSILIVFITCIPNIYGYLNSGDKYFVGFSSCNSEDFNTYLAWMHQAEAGYFLFKDQYTIEPHKRIFFHPLFFFLGKISSYFNLKLINTMHIFRIFSSFLFLFILYIFLSYFIKDKYIRRITFIMLTVSSGFGCYLILFKIITPLQQHLSLDLGFSEGVTFTVIYYTSGLFSFSLFLLLWIFLLALDFTDKLFYSFLAGTLLLILGFIHPYDLIIIYAVLFVYLLYIFFLQKNYFKKYFISFLIIFLISFYAPLYDYFVLSNEFVFKEWTKIQRPHLPFLAYISGYGFSLIFALFKTVDIFKKKDSVQHFLLIWIITSFFLGFLPVAFQRRLMIGLHIPITILGGQGLYLMVSNLKNKFVNFDYQKTIRIIIILSSFSNIGFLVTDLKTFANRDFPYYLSKEIIEGMGYLRDNTTVEQTVFSSPGIGNFIPAHSGNKVFIGHTEHTLFYSKKEKIMKKFFDEKTDNNKRQGILKKYKIDYLFYSEVEKSYGKFNPEKVNFLKKYFANSSVSIYKVK